MPQSVLVVYMDHADKKSNEQGKEEKSEKRNMVAGEVSHKWQPYSTAHDTIVK